MAGTTGLEPATSDVTGRRSNQLSYVPALWTFLNLNTRRGVLGMKLFCFTIRRLNSPDFMQK